jgi:hypothetical protein
MEIRITLFIWFCLALLGLLLMSLRNDANKYRSDAYFIMTKGTFLHKVIYVLIAFFLLPFTIPKSIKLLLKK